MASLRDANEAIRKGRFSQALKEYICLFCDQSLPEALLSTLPTNIKSASGRLKASGTCPTRVLILGDASVDVMVVKKLAAEEEGIDDRDITIATNDNYFEEVIGRVAQGTYDTVVAVEPVESWSNLASIVRCLYGSKLLRMKGQTLVSWTPSLRAGSFDEPLNRRLYSLAQELKKNTKRRKKGISFIVSSEFEQSQCTALQDQCSVATLDYEIICASNMATSLTDSKRNPGIEVEVGVGMPDGEQWNVLAHEASFSWLCFMGSGLVLGDGFISVITEIINRKDAVWAGVNVGSLGTFPDPGQIAPSFLLVKARTYNAFGPFVTWPNMETRLLSLRIQACEGLGFSALAKNAATHDECTGTIRDNDFTPNDFTITDEGLGADWQGSLTDLALPDLYYLLGYCREKQGKYEAALEAYISAAKEEPGSGKLLDRAVYAARQLGKNKGVCGYQLYASKKLRAPAV